MRKNILAITTLFLISLFPNQVLSQSKNSTYWVGFGISQANSDNNRSYGNFNFNVNWKNDYLVKHIGFDLTSNLFNSINNKYSVNYGIGYSFTLKRAILGAITAGPTLSYGTTTLNNDYGGRRAYWGIGIGINSQLYFSPLYFVLPELLLGVEPYINYSIYESRRSNMRYTYGIRFGISFRDKNK